MESNRVLTQQIQYLNNQLKTKTNQPTTNTQQPTTYKSSHFRRFEISSFFGDITFGENKTDRKPPKVTFQINRIKNHREKSMVLSEN